MAGDSPGLSVTLGLGERILNGEIPELFYSNGYLVYKIQGKSDLFLLLDLVTGIVTDCALGIHGVYCFHDQITNTQISLAQNLTSSDPSVQPEWQQSISNSSIMLGSFAAMMGTVTLGETSLAAAELFPPILLIVAPIAFLETIQPYAIEEAEQEGNFNTAEYLTNNNLKDQMWDVMLQCLGIGGPSQGVWDESYKYGSPNNPNVRQNLEDIKNMKQNARALWDGAIELFLPDDRTPTLEELADAYKKASYLLMEIAEKDDEEFLNKIIELGKITTEKKDPEEAKRVKKSIKNYEMAQKALKKVSAGDSDDGDPIKQYEKLGMALGVALLAGDYSQAIQIVIIGGLCAIGESIAETLSQKEKAENMTNNTNNTGG